MKLESPERERGRKKYLLEPWPKIFQINKNYKPTDLRIPTNPIAKKKNKATTRHIIIKLFKTNNEGNILNCPKIKNTLHTEEKLI